jgi:hypothetical protein
MDCYKDFIRNSWYKILITSLIRALKHAITKNPQRTGATCKSSAGEVISYGGQLTQYRRRDIIMTAS